MVKELQPLRRRKNRVLISPKSKSHKPESNPAPAEDPENASTPPQLTSPEKQPGGANSWDMYPEDLRVKDGCTVKLQGNMFLPLRAGQLFPANTITYARRKMLSNAGVLFIEG